MATYTKFQVFVEEVCEKVHNLGSDALKLGLTNTAPNAADTHLDTVLSPDVIEATSNAVEIAAGSGYTEGGAAVTVTTSAQVTGTYTLAANQVVFTAAGGAWPTFRYIYLYNNTGGAAATRPIIAWWDYGVGGLTLADGESLTVKFNNANPGTIFTLT